jgi:hypothetical protein
MKYLSLKRDKVGKTRIANTVKGPLIWKPWCNLPVMIEHDTGWNDVGALDPPHQRVL